MRRQAGAGSRKVPRKAVGLKTQQLRNHPLARGRLRFGSLGLPSLRSPGKGNTKYNVDNLQTGFQR